MFEINLPFSSFWNEVMVSLLLRDFSEVFDQCFASPSGKSWQKEFHEKSLLEV